MDISEELMNTFLENKCSDIEAASVLMHLHENKDALNNYFAKNEWDLTAAGGTLDGDISEITLDKLKRILFNKHSLPVVSVRLGRIYRVAAASVIVLFVLTVITNELLKKNPVINSIAAISRQTGHISDTSKPFIAWQIKTNISHIVEKVALQDGSVITLYKNSTISFPVPFPGNKREIILTGDAFFEVAKNKEKPFTVYAGSLSTTALGTSFRVTVFDAAKKNIRIKLFTGKVIVKATGKINNWKKDVLLQPGEQVSYDGTKTGAVAIVSGFNHIAKELRSTGSLPARTDIQNKDISFRNASLPEVLDALSGLFNVKIHYSNEEIAKMNFTGAIKHSDELKTILKAITLMNGLEIAESTDGFTVSKSK